MVAVQRAAAQRVVPMLVHLDAVTLAVAVLLVVLLLLLPVHLLVLQQPAVHLLVLLLVQLLLPVVHLLVLLLQTVHLLVLLPVQLLLPTVHLLVQLLLLAVLLLRPAATQVVVDFEACSASTAVAVLPRVLQPAVLPLVAILLAEPPPRRAARIRAATVAVVVSSRACLANTAVAVLPHVLQLAVLQPHRVERMAVALPIHVAATRILAISLS